MSAILNGVKQNVNAGLIKVPVTNNWSAFQFGVFGCLSDISSAVGVPLTQANNGVFRFTLIEAGVSESDIGCLEMVRSGGAIQSPTWAVAFASVPSPGAVVYLGSITFTAT